MQENIQNGDHHDPAREAYQQGLFEDMADTIIHLRGVHEAAVSHATVMEERANDALIDGVTGLPVRKELEAQLNDLFENSEHVGILFMDADRFKPLNDAFGHPVGDRVLRGWADVLVSTLRKTDITFLTGRYGGDELVAAVDLSVSENKRRGTEDLSDKQRLAEVVNRAQSAFNEYADGDPQLKQIGFGVSIGSRIRHPGETAQEVLKAADDAMYKAKQASGKGR